MKNVYFQAQVSKLLMCSRSLNHVHLLWRRPTTSGNGSQWNIDSHVPQIETESTTLSINSESLELYRLIKNIFLYSYGSLWCYLQFCWITFNSLFLFIYSYAIHITVRCFSEEWQMRLIIVTVLEGETVIISILIWQMKKLEVQSTDRFKVT